MLPANDDLNRSSSSEGEEENIPIEEGENFRTDKNNKNLDPESANFVEFVKQHAHQKEKDGGSIMFSQLLPPNKTSHAVATEGLMHVLTLATKGVLKVDQEEEEQEEGEGALYRLGGEIFLRVM